MRIADDRRQSEVRNVTTAVRVVAPPVIVILVAVGMRLLPALSRTPLAADDGPAVGLHSAELRRVREKHDRGNDHAARNAAKAFAYKHLFPDNPHVVSGLTVTRQNRGRFRVRGGVTYRDTDHKLVSRQFEADLMLGPADDIWRLVDTEFLP